MLKRSEMIVGQNVKLATGVFVLSLGKGLDEGLPGVVTMVEKQPNFPDPALTVRHPLPGTNRSIEIIHPHPFFTLEAA